MAKTKYYVKSISKTEATPILTKHHYLTNISRGFKSGFNYGCFENTESEQRLVGVVIFTGLPSPELAVGMLGFKRNEQKGLFELSRLCMVPDVQETEHNLTSWFVSRAIKQLCRDTEVRLILSYADDGYHKGTIYAACNFNYYGLTDPKKDFWERLPDGTYIKKSRGKVKGVEGEWRPRTRKHRFIYIVDKSIAINWKKIKWGNSPTNSTGGDA